MLARDVRSGDWLLCDDRVALVLGVERSPDPQYDLYFEVWLLVKGRASVDTMVFHDDSDLVNRFGYEVVR